jgi:small subunit ribosomal protein S4
MGDPARKTKTYSRPRKPWDRGRLEAERKLKKNYGLKAKRELWKTEGILRKKRQSARKLLALPLERSQQQEKELVKSLHRIGILNENAGLDDVLGLSSAEFLERRLQTIVLRKGLANTAKQARQLIVHGHIGVNGKKVTAPSYLVRTHDAIAYYGKPIVLQAPPKRENKKEETAQTIEEASNETTEEAREDAMEEAAAEAKEETTEKESE